MVVRVVHAVLGAAVGVLWLVLPGMTTTAGDPVAITGDGPVASAPAQDEEDDESSVADLVLPLVVAGVAVVLAGYGYARRTRRARTRTTPGGHPVPPPPPPFAELDARARASLVEADDCVRTSREELGFAEALFGAAAVAPFERAVRAAEAELSAAFRMRQRYDDGVPEDAAARRRALAEITGRCREAGRRLDAEAAGFDQLRGLERGGGEAPAVAEARFRELTDRTADAEGLLVELGERYPPAATAPVTGYVAQAKGRLVFAAARLDRTRRSADAGDATGAARQLRAAEGALSQAAVFVSGVERLATELSAATEMVPAALTGAEVEVAEARGWLAGGPTAASAVPVGELRARILHADIVLASVREALTGGPYDPLGALRRIVRAVVPVGVGRAGVLPAAASLVARSAVGAADGFVATHRRAVGAEARTRLAEAQRLLAAEPAEPAAADGLARQARDLAEQDVRLYGHPVAGAAEEASGAVLGGIVLGGTPDGGPPMSFGGPDTRGRRTA
ncbi:hypothetical protein NW895_10840 [Streptomyces sp. S.PNR 29]|nr:hypothetical protein [Streptomyces sp. S.PNR 29]MDN0195529.1 hypothetical protein [Streptomyces sp. S.PNR 29]